METFQNVSLVKCMRRVGKQKNGRCSYLDTPSIMSRSASKVIDLLVHGSPHGIQFGSTHLFPRADRDRAGQSAATAVAAVAMLRAIFNFQRVITPPK